MGVGLKTCRLPLGETHGPAIMDKIEKIDNVTWYGHCVIHVMAALSDLPEDAKLAFCRELEKFIQRQQSELQNNAG